MPVMSLLSLMLLDGVLDGDDLIKLQASVCFLYGFCTPSVMSPNPYGTCCAADASRFLPYNGRMPAMSNPRPSRGVVEPLPQNLKSLRGKKTGVEVAYIPDIHSR